MSTKEPSGHLIPGGHAGLCMPMNERGAALIGTVLTVLIMSMVGLVSVNLAVEETVHINTARDAAAARHLAEAGADVVMQWFHDPGSGPQGLDRHLFAKRMVLPTGPSFFDAQGRSQFAGTAEHPDFLMDAARSADDRLLHDASSGWFRGLHGMGRIEKLKVYGPSRAGLLCTVEVVASAGKARRVFSFQLGATPMPAWPSGMQVGVREPSRLSDGPFQPWVHWADVQVKGDLQLPSRQRLPEKTQHASLSGLSYADMTRPEDRWLEIKVGGSAIPAESADGQEPMPANVLAQQDPLPGLPGDPLNYDAMKRQALRYGTYYATDREGLLYPGGKVEPARGLTASQVFDAADGSRNLGLIFVDTLDQRPPTADNLGTLSIESDYLEGMLILNAHLHLKPKGDGRPIRVLSPPSSQPSSFQGDGREPVQLNGIHVNGALYVAGDLVFDGAPRLHGAVVSGGKVVSGDSRPGPFELWYNYDLNAGLMKGLPVVFIAPGTMQEQF